jgi:hypothetical protein
MDDFGILPGLLFFGALALLVLGYIALTVYGAILAFRKKWYIGLATLVVPFFATVLGISKFFFKKDLLDNA